MGDDAPNPLGDATTPSGPDVGDDGPLASPDGASFEAGGAEGGPGEAGGPDSSPGRGATTGSADNCGACGHSCLGSTCIGSLCQPVLLGAFSDTPADIAIDANFVYGTVTGGALERCSVNGCSSGAGTLKQVSQQDPIALAANASGVFWTILDSTGGGAVYGCSPATCANGLITYVNLTAGQPYGITADATNVYYSENVSGGNNFQGVMYCPLAERRRSHLLDRRGRHLRALPRADRLRRQPEPARHGERLAHRAGRRRIARVLARRDDEHRRRAYAKYTEPRYSLP
jgi:hypothetical protein